MRNLLSLLAIALSLAALPARAEEKQNPSEWTFSATPYAWLMGATGSLTAKGQTIDVNAGIVDMFGATDTLTALMANNEARRGKLAFGLDLIYTKMVATPSFATLRNPTPWLSFSAAAGANVTSTMVVVEGSASYEVWRPAPATAIDALVGLRYWHMSTDIDLAFTATGAIRTPGDVGLSRTAGFALASSGSMDWADPILGFAVRHDLAPNHHLRLRGDVGGFGVGSQFTWQTFAGYAYDFSPGSTTWAAVLGYRALGINYSAGSGLDARSVNLVLHGPVLGLTARF
jgi:hypothetical protein